MTCHDEIKNNHHYNIVSQYCPDFFFWFLICLPYLQSNLELDLQLDLFFGLF